MKFSIGYQLDENGYFLNSINQYKDKIEEIYFALPDIANGRGNSWMKTYTARDAFFKQEAELTHGNVPYTITVQTEVKILLCHRKLIRILITV